MPESNTASVAGQPNAAPTKLSSPATKEAITDRVAAKSGPTKPTVIGTSTGKKTKQRIVMIAILLVAAFGVYYFFFKPAALAVVTVRYTAVDTGDLTKAVTATGSLQATKTVQVGSQVSGTILRLYADFNSTVKKGQLLAQLDPTLYQAAVNESKANVAQATANLANAQIEEKRAAGLLASQLISQSDYDAAKTKLLDATASLAQTRAQLDRAMVNIGFTTIRSPINGKVVSRNVDVGQTVAASLNAPVIFTIAEDLQNMQVSANVDEADIGQVVMGQKVRFTVDAFTGENFEGSVLQVRINPITQQNVVTYSVIINADNPDLKLLPGMTATVSIISDARKDVMRVPNAALRFVPSPELLGTGQGVSTQQGARQSRASGGAGHKIKDSSAAPSSVIYIKMHGNQKVVALQVVRVTTGLSDGSYTEILSSKPQLTMGDSVAIGSITTGGDPKAPASAQPGASPFSTPRPGGGGGRSPRM
jgi:HlyD family secretion protein